VLERTPLIVSPTPLHRLPRAGADLGIDLWIKRDDLTGFALGGNKGRKLEYLIPQILKSGADTVVTSGAAQSNFIRHLGAACAMFGLECHAVVMPLPYEFETLDEKPKQGGNLVLDALSGVHLHPHPNGTWDELEAHTESLIQQLTDQGRKVFHVPLGGSSVAGAYAFTQAAQELTEKFDVIVTSSSSGSTQTGLAYHFNGTGTRVVGICADPEPEMVDVFADLAAQLDELLGSRQAMKPSDFELRTDFVGQGYGVPSEEGREATQHLLMHEGIFLDPIYTAKAYAGLLHMVRNGEIKGKVLFWHTGGLPGLFAYSAEQPE